MKTSQFFSLLIKLLGLYLLLNLINNIQLQLSIILHYFKAQDTYNIVVETDYTSLLVSIILLLINIVFPFLLLIKSNWIAQLILKKEEDIEINLIDKENNFIDYSKVLQFSIIFIGLILILTSIPNLIINLIDYYNLMMKLGGISSQNPNIKFHGKIYLIEIIFGYFVIVKSNSFANLINRDNRFFDAKAKIEQSQLD